MDAVDHINVDVENLDECYRFYRDVLDLNVVRDPSSFSGEHAMFSAGDTVVTLVGSRPGDRWHERGLDHPLDKAHLAFQTDRERYDALVDELDGQFPKQGPYDWGEFEGFYFLDPSGNLLEIVTDDPPPSSHSRRLLTHDDVV